MSFHSTAETCPHVGDFKVALDVLAEGDAKSAAEIVRGIGCTCHPDNVVMRCLPCWIAEKIDGGMGAEEVEGRYLAHRRWWPRGWRAREEQPPTLPATMKGRGE